MSIRLRLAVVFAIFAAGAFALGSWLLVSALSSSMLAGIDAQLAAQLSAASRYLQAGGAAAATGTPAPGEYVVQVIDPSGRVRGSGPDAGLTPMLSGTELGMARHGRIVLITADEGERERLMAGPLAIRPARAGWVGVAGVSLEAFDSTVSDVTHELIIGGAAAVAAAGLGAYALARAALSPVERLRREVAALSERDQAPGVRVPRTHDEIAALALTMNELLGRLRRALERQRALVADASHELRTPFAVLRGELELAAQPGRSREELAEAVGYASEEAARLGRITEQLLALARSDEDRMTLALEQVSVRQVLERSAEQAAPRARAAGISCDVTAPAGLTAAIDPGRIRQAVDNLVDNAVRFAPPGTAVRLSAWASGHDLVIEVTDTGPGFPAEFLPRAFERFARPDSGRGRADGGAGLGLAIVSAIARAHGGHAVARNLPGGGAAVRLELSGAAGTAAPSRAG